MCMNIHEEYTYILQKKGISWILSKNFTCICKLFEPRMSMNLIQILARYSLLWFQMLSGSKSWRKYHRGSFSCSSACRIWNWEDVRKTNREEYAHVPVQPTAPKYVLLCYLVSRTLVDVCCSHRCWVFP